MNKQQEAPVVDGVVTTSSEENQEPELKHWAHPTDSTIAWCGHTDNKPEGFADKGVAQDERTCPICVDLFNRFGSAWWWDTHQKFFGSTCRITGATTDFHDCVAA